MPKQVRKGIIKPNLMPGPNRRGPLPDLLPLGVIPPEGSMIWLATPFALKAGEAWIQDDTRQWFEDQDRKIVICRSYPTHPRWAVGSLGKLRRGSISNDNITSEIHMLARITAGLPDTPSWMAARMTVKQIQADSAYKLMKAVRKTFIDGGEEALTTMRDRQPSQYMKLVADILTAKQVDHQVTLNPGQLVSPEHAAITITAIAEELKKREGEALYLKHSPLNYEGGDALKAIEDSAQRMHQATGDNYFGQSRNVNDGSSARRLKQVIDLEADDVTEVQPQEPFQWD